MEKYYCKCCNYNTKIKRDFQTHVKSRKHIKQNSKTIDDIDKYKCIVYKCDVCEMDMFNRTTYWKHKKECEGIKNNINSIKINNTDAFLYVFQEMKDLVSQVTSQVTNLALATTDVAKETTQVTMQSMNILKHANKNLLVAQPLKKLGKDKAYRLIGYDKINDNLKFDEYKSYVGTYISKYQHNIFAEHIGNMIIGAYKPKNVNDTNILTTDTSRLSFIILQNIDPTVSPQNNELNKEWINDKSGKRFKTMILKPLLEALADIIGKFIKLSENRKYHMVDEEIEVFRFMHECIKLKRDLDNEKFTNPILKYVAPSFSFDAFKPDNLKN